VKKQPGAGPHLPLRPLCNAAAEAESSAMQHRPHCSVGSKLTHLKDLPVLAACV
jgi:hypothetical protein